jgi:hypothetical protein
MATRKKRRLPKLEYKNTNEVERETSSFRDIALILTILWAVLWYAALAS